MTPSGTFFPIVYYVEYLQQQATILERAGLVHRPNIKCKARTLLHQDLSHSVLSIVQVRLGLGMLIHQVTLVVISHTCKAMVDSRADISTECLRLILFADWLVCEIKR